MFSTPFTYFNSQEIIPVYDSDYQAVLDYGFAQGWTLPSSTTRTKDNTMILALKSAGIWNKLDVFYMFSTDGDSNFASINWKNPGTWNATLVGGIPFTTNSGFTGNTTSYYIRVTGYIPLGASGVGVNYTLNNASRYFWKGNSGVSGIMDGNSTAAYNTMQTASTGNQRINQTVALNTGYSYSNTIGLRSIHRTSSNDVTLINNTTAATRTAASTTSGANSEQWILRSGTTYAAHLVRMYSLGGSLVSENTSYYNAINTRLS